jgi:hypothetical protein
MKRLNRINLPQGSILILGENVKCDIFTIPENTKIFTDGYRIEAERKIEVKGLIVGNGYGIRQHLKKFMFWLIRQL